MSDSRTSGSETAVANGWPALPLDDWRETYITLHMWTQIVGKVRLALTPLVNHWWNVPLYVTARGLSTSAMPLPDRHLEILFDFLDHQLQITCSDGLHKTIPLTPKSVADFYRELMDSLKAIGVNVRIWPVPVEISNPIPFEQDTQHAAYDAQYVTRLWHILSHAEQVFQQFRAKFIGKCSRVHFFWGSFDLAVTRFSGRRAPDRPGADRITREAYSHECISHGFWPGGAWLGTEISSPLFYSYTAPEPPGLRNASIRPSIAHFDTKLGEFVLPYDTLRNVPSADQALTDFLQSTYEAGANCAAWDRSALERNAE
ncbi:MAG TPA: DUF5996 family protein [Tepidisphaeraceae bacterium]